MSESQTTQDVCVKHVERQAHLMEIEDQLCKVLDAAMPRTHQLSLLALSASSEVQVNVECTYIAGGSS